MRSLTYLGIAAVFSGALCGQSVPSAPKFGSAEVYASGPNTMPEMRNRFVRGRYQLLNATLVDLIRTAWGVDADKVVGGPEWLDLDRFDVIATAPAESSKDTLKTMLRAFLEDRFELVAHRGSKDMRAYALTAGKNVQLKAADGTEETGCNQRPTGSPTVIAFECRNITMAAFADTMAHFNQANGYLFNYKVVDRTGLKGAWNFDLKWTPRMFWQRAPATTDTITIFDAFEKQLGLKLSMSAVATPVVMVDRVNAKPVGLKERPRGPFEFEVAEIKPDEDQNRMGLSVGIQPGGRVNIMGTLKGMIQEAWGNMRLDRILGLTRPMDVTRWVVEAKAPVEEGAAKGWNGPVWEGVDVDSMRMMLRSLLVDRFKLVAHNEDRLVNGYELVAGKPKVRKADPSNRPGCKEGPGADGKDPRIDNPVASRLITCRNMTLAQFAAQLSEELFHLPAVADSTGIAGRYDLTVNFSPNTAVQIPQPGADGSIVAPEPDGAISLEEALSKQLGLKLRPKKVMAQVLVVDHVEETPTPN